MPFYTNNYFLDKLIKKKQYTLHLDYISDGIINEFTTKIKSFTYLILDEWTVMIEW